ncbi:hypothetical protein GWK47_041208 [Chionoecetes opilio]|uniref:Uncharacterized protein n=1 Tax=Chionoecetes opilio TaxID=41210 RepID=A0A8J4YJ67_CHIOP|nr:hypothetical protein GWK47_041208 [Chionoecetes opilio]
MILTDIEEYKLRKSKRNRTTDTETKKREEFLANTRQTFWIVQPEFEKRLAAKQQLEKQDQTDKEDWLYLEGVLNDHPLDTSRIGALVFDTTAVNSGVWSGVVVRLETEFGRSLLQLACRHHIHELIGGASCSIVYGPTTGPNEQLFKRLTWIENSTKETLRHDYLELAELTLLFLGGTSLPVGDPSPSKRLGHSITPVGLARLCTPFVKLPVAQWTTSDNYRHGKKVVANLPVVNDAAERALGLATDLNTNKAPKSEEQLQALYRVCEGCPREAAWTGNVN